MRISKLNKTGSCPFNNDVLCAKRSLMDSIKRSAKISAFKDIPRIKAGNEYFPVLTDCLNCAYIGNARIEKEAVRLER